MKWLVTGEATHPDGYRFGEWTLIDAGTRIAKLIEQNPT